MGCQTGLNDLSWILYSLCDLHLASNLAQIFFLRTILFIKFWIFVGLDSADLVSKLRASHAEDENGTKSGIDVLTGGVGDMSKLGIYEAFKVLPFFFCFLSNH